MEHLHNKQANIIGYTILALVIFSLALIYVPKFDFTATNFCPIIFLLAGALAIIDVTVSVFWMWKRERSDILENYLGPIGHVLHCGYCLALWLSALAVGFLGITFFKNFDLPKLLEFLLSWWALSFVTALFYEILTLLWFRKLKLEFYIREYYKNKASQ